MSDENKVIRRMLVLKKILNASQKIKPTHVTFEDTTKENKTQLLQISIDPPPQDLKQKFDLLFTNKSMTFVSELVTKFEHRVDQLNWNRLLRKIRINTTFKIPEFANTSQRKDGTWKIKTLPEKLKCRHLDLGDVSPANTDHFINSLNTHVDGIQVDFDDGHCPSWRNQIIGLYNVYSVVHGLIKLKNPDLPILMLRPRAWNMVDHNIMVNGKKLAGPLVDFGLLMYHNGLKLMETESGPFFYLSKLEGADEAKLWNDIFIWTQKRLGIPQGTIKACVLIENILASFEMEEILYELKEHSLGLNCGIWDYAASIINKFGNNPEFLLPDRNKYVNMDRHFLKKYMELVIQTCHKRGAPATGGMAALLLRNNNDGETIQKVIDSKAKEIEMGCDGFLIYDSKLITHMKQLWNNSSPNFNQITKIPTSNITEQDLLKIPEGNVTLPGLQHNIAIAILFINSWLEGKGHFMYKNAVEDSATAEISRSQIWQWIRHKAKIEQTDKIVTKDLVEKLSTQFVQECYNLDDYNTLHISRQLFMDLVTARYFVDFITTYLNDSPIFRETKSKSL